MRNEERVVPTPARDLDLREIRDPSPVSSEDLREGVNLLRKTWGSMSGKSI